MFHRQKFLDLHQEVDKCIRYKLGDRIEWSNSHTYLDFLLVPKLVAKCSWLERFVSEESKMMDRDWIRIIDGAS